MIRCKQCLLLLTGHVSPKPSIFLVSYLSSAAAHHAPEQAVRPPGSQGATRSWHRTGTNLCSLEGQGTATLAGGESQIRAHRRLKERGSRRRRSSSAKELRSRHRPVRRSRGGARGSTVGNHQGIGWFSGIGSASEGHKYSLVGRKNWACENIGHLFGQLLELCFACACPKLIFGSKFKAL